MRGGYRPIPMRYVPLHDRLPQHPLLIQAAIQQTRSSVLAPIRDTLGQCVMSDLLQPVRRVRAMDHCFSGDVAIHSRVLVLSRPSYDRSHSLVSQLLMWLTSSSLLVVILMTGSLLQMIIAGDELV